jgi:hypothetical protein
MVRFTFEQADTKWADHTKTQGHSAIIGQHCKNSRHGRRPLATPKSSYTFDGTYSAAVMLMVSRAAWKAATFTHSALAHDYSHDNA